MRRSRYDAFGIAVTNPKKIVVLALLYSYGFGAVLHTRDDVIHGTRNFSNCVRTLRLGDLA